MRKVCLMSPRINFSLNLKTTPTLKGAAKNVPLGNEKGNPRVNCTESKNLSRTLLILNYGDTLVSENSIEENDSVEFSYTGKLIDNLIFSTSVDSIAQNEGLTLEETISILYLESGENVLNVFIKGFAEGIIKSFKKVGLNSHILLLLPSDLAYGNQ